MHIDDEDRDDDGEGDEDHDKEQVLADQRDHLGRRRDDLLNDQEEDGERDEHGRGQRELFAFIGREIENQDGQEGQAEAWDDQEERVEQRQSL